MAAFRVTSIYRACGISGKVCSFKILLSPNEPSAFYILTPYLPFGLLAFFSLLVLYLPTVRIQPGQIMGKDLKCWVTLWSG